jgi:hypothetical protein
LSESGREQSLFTDVAKRRRRIGTVPVLNRDGLLWPLSLFLITVITRIPFTSKLLYHTDSVHFALALQKYDITVHQPHPPGYFLYVMLGRLLNLVVEDANTIFVSVSVIFSGLAVVAIYFLSKEIYSGRTGLLAAVLAITSPNFWFHGEVALSYMVEAFFSATVALFCWRIYRGEHKYIWLSVIALGIAGGIRQNTVVFLLPLWLFSVRKAPIRKVVLSVLLLGFVCLLWFVPMLRMTGGWDAYRNAFRELWLFNTGRFSVFERGWEELRFFSYLIFTFTLYGIGSGIFVLGLAVYSLVRNRKFGLLNRDKALFFSIWMAPSVLFYLLIFIHPSNPGYALIFLPPLLILTAMTIEYLAGKIPLPSISVATTGSRRRLIMIASTIVITNAAVFCFSDLPVSYKEIKNHDRDLSVMLGALSRFDPSKTAIFVKPYVFFNFRHIMYYLPEYRVYQVDVRRSPAGEMRKIFWGEGRETFLTDEIILPENVSTFVVPLIPEERNSLLRINGVKMLDLNTVNRLSIASGDITLIKKVYPELNVRLPNSRLNGAA